MTFLQCHPADLPADSPILKKRDWLIVSGGRKAHRAGFIIPRELEAHIAAISEHYGITRTALLGRRRGRLSIARGALYSALVADGHTYHAIGRALDRDHTSIRQGHLNHLERTGATQ